jgi:Tfp pilus assembly protein PilO
MSSRAIVTRVLSDKRVWVAPLAVALLLNAAGYTLVVYPLSVKVGNAREREQAAQLELLAAQRDNMNAEAARAARDRASSALSVFYTDVLPHDLAGARRITYLRLAQLAQKLGLRAQRRSSEPEEAERNSSLRRLKILMTLAGDYEDMRQFIYQLETAPEFVVIEDIALSEAGEPGSPLVLTVELSTYYQANANGT